MQNRQSSKQHFDRRRILAAGALVLGLSYGLLSALPAPVLAQEGDRLRGIVEPIQASKPLTIGVTLVHLHDDFWKGIAYGIVDEAEKSGVEVVQISVAGAYGNVREQFAQLETLKSLDVDVAVIGAAAFDGYDGALKSLKDGGISVVAAGIPVNSAFVDFGVTQDDKAIGVALAGVVCGDLGGGEGEAITIPGPAGAEWARLRHVGFLEESAKCSGLTVIEGPVGGGMGIEQGLAQASDLLLKNDNASYVYTPEVSLGMGAVQAGRQLGRQIEVVTSAVVREAIPLVEAGRILATVSEPGIVMGRLIVQYAIRQNEGMDLPELVQPDGAPYPYLLVPTVVITPENSQTYPFELYELPPKDWSIEAMQ